MNNMKWLATSLVAAAALVALAESAQAAPLKSIDQARTIACAHALQEGFELNATCEKAMPEVTHEDQRAYYFNGTDKDGACFIEVRVSKSSRRASSEVECI